MLPNIPQLFHSVNRTAASQMSLVEPFPHVRMQVDRLWHFPLTYLQAHAQIPYIIYQSSPTKLSVSAFLVVACGTARLLVAPKDADRAIFFWLTPHAYWWILYIFHTLTSARALRMVQQVWLVFLGRWLILKTSGGRQRNIWLSGLWWTVLR